MLMVFLLIMPGVMSGLGNLLVPIQLCVPEMVFPKVNNLGTIGTSCAGTLPGVPPVPMLCRGKPTHTNTPTYR